MYYSALKWYFFFSSRRRHTRCALVTGVQTCALPICFPAWPPGEREQAQRIDERIAQIIDRIRHERARARRQSATKFDREHERVDHQDCDPHAALIVPAGKGLEFLGFRRAALIGHQHSPTRQRRFLGCGVRSTKNRSRSPPGERRSVVKGKSG